MNYITGFLSGINDVFLKMTWLSEGIAWLLSILGLDITTQLGGSIHFWLYDIIKIFILLAVLIFGISWIQSFFPPERTRQILGGIKGIKGNIIGALLGTITPFCSCSSIPIFIGFTSAGLPVGITFSFLISSPLVDLASLMILISFFGFKIAIAYVLIGLLLAIVGGTLIDKLGMEKHVQSYVREYGNQDNGYIVLDTKQRLDYAKGQVKDIFHKVWPYVILGVSIGALIHNWIPQSIVEQVVGSDNPFAVILATGLGVPMYADIFGTLPIAEALLLKGAGVGTVLAFMMAVTALSLPSMVMLSKVVDKKLMALFITYISIGIIIIGYVLNAFSYLLL